MSDTFRDSRNQLKGCTVLTFIHIEFYSDLVHSVWFVLYIYI